MKETNTSHRPLSKLSPPLTLSAAAVALAVATAALPLGPNPAVVLAGASVVLVAYALWLSITQSKMHRLAPLTLALLAIATVLPELAVGAHLAWRGAETASGEMAHLALAGATGASRALIGTVWPLAILLTWVAARGKGTPARPQPASLWFLLLAALYHFTVYLKGFMSILDTLFLSLLFVGYVWMLSRSRHASEASDGEPAEEGDRRESRRGWRPGQVLVAAATLGAASVFAMAFAPVAAAAGADGFRLAQWLVALCSKLPLLLVVWVVARRAWTPGAASVLASSHIALLTLVMAAIPLAYFAHGVVLGEPRSLALDEGQRSEVLLMAVGSLFLAVVLSGRALPLKSAVSLAALFLVEAWASTLEPEGQAVMARNMLAAAYLAAAAALFFRDPTRLETLLGAMPRDGLRIGRRRAATQGIS